MPVVCFTGRGVIAGGVFYDRANWGRWTTAAGWHVIDHVDWGTTYLVASRTNTKKAADARTKGTQVITYDQYLSILRGLDQQANDLPGRSWPPQFTGQCMTCGTVYGITPGYIECDTCRGSPPAAPIGAIVDHHSCPNGRVRVTWTNGYRLDIDPVTHEINLTTNQVRPRQMRAAVLPTRRRALNLDE